jgi:hypothetical protein
MCALLLSPGPPDPSGVHAAFRAHACIALTEAPGTVPATVTRCLDDRRIIAVSS